MLSLGLTASCHAQVMQHASSASWNKTVGTTEKKKLQIEKKNIKPTMLILQGY